MHHVALLAGHARRCALVRVGGVRGAGGIRGLAVGGHRDAAVRARHGDDLHELPNGLDRARVAHGAPLPLELAGPAGAPSPRLDAHDGVSPRIEGRILAEHLDADDVFLQFISASFELLGHDELEESLQAVDLLERCASQYAIELKTRAFCGRFRSV